MTEASRGVPLGVTVRLGHAAVQRVADASGIRILHIKGYAVDPEVVPERIGTDVDVLVDPAEVDAFLSELQSAGWRRVIGFRAGSPFGHAAALWHQSWGYVDVHRHFPGIGARPRDAFEILWQDHRQREIASVTCTVPNPGAQSLILVLNAARSKASVPGRDVHAAWLDAGEARRAEVEALVESLHAHVAFAAATGRLDDYRDHREYALWKAVSRGGTRFEEWRARILAAPTWREAAHTALFAPLVNVEHLTVVLHRPPTRREIVREFLARPVRGLREQLRVLRNPGGRRA